ncbi:MAG: tetratricopeptide repeat protein [Terriglobales bacterium]
MILLTLPAVAQLRQIRLDRLPADPSVRAAYGEALKLEPLTGDFQPEWKFSASKADVASAMQRALGALQRAVPNDPGNEELLLLTGMVAAQANNVDVSGSFAATQTALQKASQLDPHDPRPAGLLGALQCGEGDSVTGMNTFLGVAKDFAPGQLSAGFWSSYLTCSIFAHMLEHVILAADNLRAMRPLTVAEKQSESEARRLLVVPDPGKSYSPGDFWSEFPIPGSTASDMVTFVCGYRLPRDGKGQLMLYPMQKNACIVQTKYGPLVAAGGGTSYSINILVIAQPATPGQSLANFAHGFVQRFSSQPAAVPTCPAPPCLAYSLISVSRGGEAGFVTIFRSRAPRYPGLIFEAPRHLDDKNDQRNPQYRQLLPRLTRGADEINFTVVLDAAPPILTQAMTIDQKYLAGLVVDTAAALNESKPGRMLDAAVKNPYN